MRDIRARIGERQGADLTEQQIQDLAARRLESILEIRSLPAELVAQWRRAAGAPEAQEAAPPEPPYTFDDSTMYGAGILAGLRRLMRPVLALFVDLAPVSKALGTQVELNRQLLGRDAARERRQSEWNALQYEVLQRLVLEQARLSLEAQNLSMRVESLSAKVDFNERRVRAIEGQAPLTRSLPRAETLSVTDSAPRDGGVEAGGASEGSRRRRRRRRGRRTGFPDQPGALVTGEAGTLAPGDPDETDEVSESPDHDVQEHVQPQPHAQPGPDATSSPPEFRAAVPVAEPVPPRDEPVLEAPPAADSPDTERPDR
jgi:hypothetical protein